ncbi:MAG: transposase [Actinomycetota bacterium]|nr:transposase [Actinomycetota bacterium]
MGKGATSRRYSEEFKRDAVALYRSSGKPLTVVAQQLGISDTSLGTWVRESDNAGGQTDLELSKEEARLRKRIRELEEEIEILKRFTKYWVKESGR